MIVAVLATPDWLDRRRVATYVGRLAEKHHLAIVVTTSGYVADAALAAGLRAAEIEPRPAVQLDLGPKPVFHMDWWTRGDDDQLEGYLDASERFQKEEADYHRRLGGLADSWGLVLRQLGPLRQDEITLSRRFATRDEALTASVEEAVELAEQIVVFERQPNSQAAVLAGRSGRPCQLIR